METFNIYNQIAAELKEFFETKIPIANTQHTENPALRNLTKKNTTFMFSQYETLNLIDLYSNSKFEKGELDSEGQQKIFLNVGTFRSDVASKMVDLDTKDFEFLPEEGSEVEPAYFCGKEFRVWAKKNYFGDLINELVENYPKYGTVVIKRVGKELVRVPLKNLRNQQDARDLQTARYVIEEHRDMTMDEMEEMPNWDTSKLDLKFGQKVTVYERYGRIPVSLYKQHNNIPVDAGDDKKSYDCMIVCTLTKTQGTKDDWGGTILFLEQIMTRPYLEVHWKKQDGRWLGIGEMENQFENQKARNMIANLRRRALYWSSKNIFQSPSDLIARNLVRDVKDGEVLKIEANGEIKRVDMASRTTGEFASFESVLDHNSDQKSFTYEVATGETLPSGTPFRLGVLLSSAVKSHFDLKREKLGLFLKKVIIKFVLPQFKKENSAEHLLSLFSSDEGYELVKKALIDEETNQELFKQLFEGRWPNKALIRGTVATKVESQKVLFKKIPENFYDEVNKIEITVTGEEIDVNAKITTLTTLYQSMVQKGDPRADKVLERIVALTGGNIDAFGAQPNIPKPVASPVQVQPTANNLPVPNGSTPAVV